MNPDLDILATTLYVTVDDLLIRNPHWAPERPAVGIAPKLSDAELVTLAVIQVLLRYDSEARFLRYAHAHLGPWFPYLPARPGYNKRLRHSAQLLQHVIAWLASELSKLVGRSVAGGLDPGRMRTQPPDRPAL